MNNRHLKAASRATLALLAAAMLAACSTANSGVYSGSNGKTLLVSKSDWADFQEYLGKIGSTRNGAFAMAVYQGHSDGWSSLTCPVDNCYGNSFSVQAMRDCRKYGECVLFAQDQRILVNYKVEDE